MPQCSTFPRFRFRRCCHDRNGHSLRNRLHCNSKHQRFFQIPRSCLFPQTVFRFALESNLIFLAFISNDKGFLFIRFSSPHRFSTCVRTVALICRSRFRIFISAVRSVVPTARCVTAISVRSAIFLDLVCNSACTFITPVQCFSR